VRERIREGKSGGQIVRLSSEMDVQGHSLVAVYVNAMVWVKSRSNGDFKTEEMSKWGTRWVRRRNVVLACRRAILHGCMHA
jgi:hypothetical protein